MALFQEEEVTQEQFNDKYKLNQPDLFSNLGYDDILKQREEDRQKRIEDERQWVSNIVSPDKVNEWKNQGSMSAIQVFHKKNKNELVPYMGTWKEGTKSFDIKRISDKIQTGQIITPEERKKFEDYILDLAEIQTRGYTLGGKAMNLGLETIPFMAEFAIGLLTSGGTASVGATSSKLSTEVLKKSLKQQIAEGVKKTVYNATINPRTYAFTATRLPQQVRARMGDVMLSDAVAVSPEGQAILQESEEKPAIAFMKALALTNIETASELSGAMLVRPVLKGAGQLSKVIASPVLKHLPESFTEKFVKLAEQVTKLPFAKAVDDLGFNGILEEMGEERVGDLLQFAFNLDNEEGYSFEQLLDAVFPSGEDLLAEAMSFGVTGLGMNAVDKGLKSIPKVKEKYTKDGFLIDAGIFRVAGYDSYIDSKVKEELEKRGKSEEEIDNAINFSTRDDKVQFLKETNTPFDSKKEYDDKEFEKELKRAEVEDKAYEKLTQGGVNQDVAFANAKLFGQFFKKYGSGNIKAFNEWFDKFDVQYNVPVKGEQTITNEQTSINEQFTSNLGSLSSQMKEAPKEENIIQDYGEHLEGAKKDKVTKEENNINESDIEKILKKVKSDSQKEQVKKYLEALEPEYVQQIAQLNLPVRISVDSDGQERLLYRKPKNRYWYALTPESMSDYKESLKKTSFTYSASTRGTLYLWGKKGNGSWLPLIEFESEKEMEEHKANHSQEQLQEIYEEMTSYKQTSKEIRERKGEDYRQGKNVTEKELADTFGFRGVQFGNYENNAKRQKEINNTFDSLKDLAKILNIPDKAISLDGTLGIAFGARGSGNAAAHYESDSKIINITRDSGAGALAHEWFHALDDYLGRENGYKGNNFVTKNSQYGVLRDELKDKFFKYIAGLHKEKDFYARLRQLGNYWKRSWEISARIFEQYVYDKTEAKGEINDYLAQDKSSDKPYLTKEEQQRIFPLLDDFFSELKYKETEKGYTLYQNQNIYFQSAYHGTPHRFDKFSTEHIGSGEGAQAHGWGLYFAGSKDVSEGYRKKLAKVDSEYVIPADVLYDGKEISNNSDFLLALETTKNEGKEKGIQQLEDEIAKCEYAIKDYTNEIKKLNNIINRVKNGAEETKRLTDAFTHTIADLKDFIKEFRKQIEFIKELDIDKLEVSRQGIGQLYKVDIPETEELLNEDKKFSEQPKNIQNKLSLIADNNNYQQLKTAIEEDAIGKDLYEALSNEEGSDKDASLHLNDYGVKGITYNGWQDGRCYVIFDDNAVDIQKTYYQEAGEGGELDKQLIAGYTFAEVLEKYSQLQEELGDESKSKEEKDRINEKIDVLEEAFDIAQNPNKFSNEEHSSEVMLNAYYIMNNQEIPKDYVDNEVKYTKNWQDYVNQHIEKKERKEAEYYGYFTEGQNKNIITIMENHDSSTALHELGHLFLNGLNELAKVDENAQKQLEAVNKWLGYSGEYTVQQQEKFARSFEAYLYKGKAPNNSLRQVFENFKEWLKSVYEDITSLQNKGADISEEVQELFDNMFGNDQYYQERKQANELLAKVRNIVRKERFNDIPVRDDKELDETAKRHKEIAYQILSAGTGKSVKYLKTIFETGSKKQSFGKKREAIQELLDKVDDKITVSGGMRAEWREFFTDTGVSYDTDETDGDYKLVEQALDVILNKSYGTENISNELDERAQYYEKAIDEADRQYKILLSNFRKGNRNVVLSAIYEWLENLDEEIRQDYEDRFIYDSGVIERNENVDKFDKAKRQILQKAMELQNPLNINKDENYQELVKEIVRSLDFLQPLDKAKLTANILDVPSTDWLMSSLDNIMDIAKTMEDVNLRRNLEREIHKELQGTKNVKKNGRSVGKYDYKTNKLFEELRALDRLSPEAANERRLEESRLATAEDNGLSFKDKLVNKFLSYKSAGRTFADTELMKELYDAIVKIKLAGKSAKSELDLIEKLDETKDIEELINIVQNKKESNILLKGYVSLVGNLESTLNAIFNKNIKDRYGAEILYAETQAQAWQHEQKQKFEKEVAKIYNLPEWCWDKKILEYLGKEYVYPEIRRKYDAEGELVKTRSIDRTLTHMDIIQAYIWSKNEVLEKRLINQFGEDTLNSMFDELSLEDVKLAELMMNTAQSFYPLVNKAFIRKYGLDLPKVSCYFPSTPERGTEVDLYNDYSSKSLNNSFTKARAQSETQAMDFHNPLATLYNHIEGVSKFVFMSDSLDKANLRFKDLDLKRVIINKYGEDVYKTLEQELINVTYKKEAPVFNGMDKIIDNMVGNWIQANVAVKPIVGLKQLLSANNYALDMPYMKWQAGFLKALAHPKETIDYVMNIPYIKARYQGSYANEFLKQTVENSAFAMSKKLKDLCNMFIKMGDIGAIIFGGKPYIDYLIEEKGMTEEQAIKQFILSTNRSQQSSAVSSLSNFQVKMTRSPMGKLFIAFKNSPQQYIRMCGDAIVSTANGDMTKTQCAKMLFQFGYLQPFFYAMATSGSLLRFLFTGDDDDLMKDASISIFNFGSDALPVIGDIYKFALNRLAYNEYYMPQTTPLLGDIQTEIVKISKEDVTIADYLDAVGYLGLHVGLGYNSKAFTNMGSGVGDIVTGDVGQGAMKVLGYTDRRAKKITGNEDKKKKKKK